MTEKRTVEADVEESGSGHYEKVLARRAEWLELQTTGPFVVSGDDKEFQIGRQGRLKYLLHPQLDQGQVLRDWSVFIHELPESSGKHTHQGGIVIFILEGHGYSVLNGVRYDWKPGDLIVMPLVEGGIEHQHFNSDPSSPARWMAFRSYWIRDHIGSELTQKEDSPEWSRNQAGERQDEVTSGAR